MSSPVKRSAEQAFEGGDAPTPKPHKKHRKDKKERPDSADEQLQTEIHDSRETIATNGIPEDSGSRVEPSNPHSHHQDRSDEASRLARRREKKQRQKARRKSEAENPTITCNSEQPVAQSAEEPGDQQKSKKKKNKKSKRKSGPASEGQGVAETHPEDHIEEVPVQSSETTPKNKKKKHRSLKHASGTGELPRHPPTNVSQPLPHQSDSGVPAASGAEPNFKQEKREKRKKKLRLGKSHRQSLDSNGTTGVADTPQQQAERMQGPTDYAPLISGIDKGYPEKKRKNRSRAKRKAGGLPVEARARTTDELVQRGSIIPLEDRIELPPRDENGALLEVLMDDLDQADSDHENDQGMDLTGLAPLEDRIEAPVAQKSKLMNKKKKRKESVEETVHRSKNGWFLSLGAGGIFIDHDPLLTSDDEHLILPTKLDVRVYARSTSLLVRRLTPEMSTSDQGIVCCTLSKSNPSMLLIATSSGSISCWDWTEGTQIKWWRPRDVVCQIVSMASTPEVENVLVVTCTAGSRDSTLAIRSLRRSSQDQQTEFEVAKRIDINANVCFFEDAGVIVATSRARVLLGYCPPTRKQSSPNMFDWREVQVTGNIISLDARATGEKRAGNTPRVDIAVGVNSGQVLLYEDLLFRLIGKEKNKAVDVQARIMHWHRNAVNAVKWSRDGNYLISGGRETVLVLWQLDTNKNQHLPHLSSEIMNVSVSPRGSSYAVRLGDNSVMVLSSANLDATTNVSGFAAAHYSQALVPVSLNPTSPDQLLIAIPNHASRRDLSAFALQIYDLNTDRELSRQALTRNMTTVVATEAQGNSNIEPNVIHLQPSVDGKWLATVEEWSADRHDLDGVTLTGEDDTADFGSEICLKIWLHNEQHGDWELVNRIDNPHSTGTRKVLALNSSPSRSEFSTAGSDGKVRIWRPKARVRDGVAVRNDKGEQLYNWTQTKMVSCATTTEANAPVYLSSAALAYSPDGTVVAVSWSTALPGPRWTYLLDCEKGTICHSMPDLVSSGAASMVFTDRYLVCVSDWICIYDTVSSTTLSKTALDPEYQSPNLRHRKYLAASMFDGTVAIGINSNSNKGPARLAIIDVKALSSPTGTDPALFEQEIPARILAVLSSPSMQGYIIIDGDANIYRLKRTGESGLTALSNGTVSGIDQSRENADVKKGLDRIFGQPRNQTLPQMAALDDGDLTKMLTNGGGEQTASSSGKTVEDVLGFQTTAQVPRVRELFDRIAGLFRSGA